VFDKSLYKVTEKLHFQVPSLFNSELTVSSGGGYTSVSSDAVRINH